MNIFLGLNTAKDINLAAKVKTKLNKHNISYNLDFYNLESLNSTHSLNLSENRIDNIKGGHRKIREDLMKVLYNIKTKNDYLDGMQLLEEEKLYKSALFEFFDNLPEYDLFCFSIYKRYMINYIVIIDILKKKFPHAQFLIGGPEIALEDGSKEIFETLGCFTSNGDIDSSVFNLVVGSNHKSFMNMTQLTKYDVPEYTQEELDYLNNNIQLTSSRGCPNNCYFCSTPKISNFNAIKREVYVDWINHYNSAGVQEILIADNTLNSFQFDSFLDGLIRTNNKIKLTEADITFNSLTIGQISKMGKAGFKSVSLGIEGVLTGESINKKMPNPAETKVLISALMNEGIDVNLFYIFGFPGQSRDDFNRELEILTVINQKHPKVTFELYPYFLSPKSFIHLNKDQFGVKIAYIDNTYESIMPEFTESLRKMIYDYSYDGIEDLYNRQNIIYSVLTNLRG